jgi:anti-sigma B factor antagonist
MARSELYATCSIDPAMVIVFKPSHILSADIVNEMHDSLSDLARHARETRFVLDFSRVGYLSSSALGMLIGLQRDFAKRDCQMKLVGMSDENREIFRITKLDRVFDIYNDTQAALQAFRTDA